MSSSIVSKIGMSLLLESDLAPFLRLGFFQKGMVREVGGCDCEGLRDGGLGVSAVVVCAAVLLLCYELVTGIQMGTGDVVAIC